MLKFLHIENIAVIEKSDIEFTDGFNVLTGETGAGKSVLIGSINAVLGMRTSKDLIRYGCDKCEVKALFCDLTSQAKNFANEIGYPPDEDGNLLISRSIHADGRNTIKINGAPATVGILRDLGKNLINIHGQHDNQLLLDTSTHINFIDALAENNDILTEYNAEFNKFNSIRRELVELNADADDKDRLVELLTYQIKEIEDANITVGEMASLKQTAKLMHDSKKIGQLITQISNCLYGSDESSGAVQLTEVAADSAIRSDYKPLAELGEKLSSLSYELASVNDSARDILSNIEYDPEKLSYIEDRLDLLKKVCNKYGSNEEQVLEFLENAKQRLSNINISEERAEELQNELLISKENLVKYGQELTKSRSNAAELFEKQVCSVLEELDMPNVKLVTQINQGRYTKIGCDEIEFLISVNAGEIPKPLAKIASGGELSRIMLAIKSVLADKDNINTMIFDEIDTGISGRAAQKISNQLNCLAKNSQIICVTHLAQIAASASNHLLIEKDTQNNRTYTNITPLDYNGRIKEISRIMSGSDMTQNMYNSAKELLDRSNKNDTI